VDTIDADFRAAELTRLARLASDFAIDPSGANDLEATRERARLDATDVHAQAALAAAELVLGHGIEALAAAQATIALDADDPTARYVLASLAAERGDGVEAQTQLSALRATGRDGYDVEMLAAAAATMRHAPTDARAALERAIAIDPTRLDAPHALFEGASPTDTVLRLREARRLVDLDEHDRDALAYVLDALDTSGDTAGLDALVERTLTTDPERARGHELLERSYERRGRLDDALYEADTWLLLAPERAAEIQGVRARLLHALHREREASEADALAQPPSP
jgi:tetratricopeptide (TPR) repeat protein